MTTSIICGDALTELKKLPSDYFHMCVTSPPYFSLRDYGTGSWEDGDPACDHIEMTCGMSDKNTLGRNGHLPETNAANVGRRQAFRDICGKCGARRIDQQIGLERSPDEWCARLVEVFREVRRVLRPDGVCFVNIGDSYAGSWGNQGRKEGRGTQRPINGGMISQVHDGRYPERGGNTGKIPDGSGLKPKDLIGAPWMLAFALRADGWWLRGDYIWAKKNCMPESVTDRCTKSHEYIFHLSNSDRYFWDQQAVREPDLGTDHRHRNVLNGQPSLEPSGGLKSAHSGLCTVEGRNGTGRNLRSVWTIATDPLPSIEVDGEKLDHFASYPTELARRCILAGTSARGCCPACGAPWARVVEREFGEAIEVRGYQAGGNAASPFITHGQGSPNSVGYPNSMQLTPRGGTRSETTGWRPTCSCPPAEPIPCRVLDPFFGSGRTGLACEELGRDCVGIELNPASVRMAKTQIERAKARRMIGRDVTGNEKPAAGQLTLF